MDRGRRDQEDRAQNNQRRSGRNDVEGPLDNGVFRVQLRPGDGEDRGVEGLDVPRFLHKDIPDVRQEEAHDALFLAVLGDAVAAAAVHPRDEDGVVALQLVSDALEAVSVIAELFFDAVEALARLSAEGAEALFIQIVPIDQDRPLHRIEAEVETVCKVGPDCIQHQLEEKLAQKDPGCIPVFPGKADDEPHDRRAEELRQSLGKDEGSDPRIAQEVSVIGAEEKKQKNAVSERHIIVIAETVVRQIGEPAEAI